MRALGRQQPPDRYGNSHDHWIGCSPRREKSDTASEGDKNRNNSGEDTSDINTTKQQ